MDYNYDVQTYQGKAQMYWEVVWMNRIENETVSQSVTPGNYQH
jgi:hypothetical protein